MNDRIFDLLYKLEQREIEEKSRQKELLNRNMPTSKPESQSIKQWIQRIWQRLFSTIARDRKGSVDDEQHVKTATYVSL